MTTKDQTNGVAELLERVKAATGPDRELDAALFIALVEPAWHTSPKDPGAVAADKQYFWPEGKLKYLTRNSKVAPQYTASVDAALALVDRCGFPLGLGAWNYTMAAAYGFFSIIPNEPKSFGIHDKRCGHARGAPTIPLAILIALLTALIAKETP